MNSKRHDRMAGSCGTIDHAFGCDGFADPSMAGAQQGVPDHRAVRIRRRVVIEDQVVTVSTVFRRPAPATRTQTFASFFEMSIPAQRG